ncbi:uncharacterized protein N7459_009876 [Penicillium hispanicum]|uniref:uncharacterized protein n=1 Tax=Penicillium hispanicum TaxID=1080232 RepID=UPI00253F90C0|nr:uncharacterized protein N7459_009876 [Penicillium hispanicum]KAJ5570446.1 hypothetical protein N7459_009876 [Penicillium hispanicum]
MWVCMHWKTIILPTLKGEVPILGGDPVLKGLGCPAVDEETSWNTDGDGEQGRIINYSAN